MDKNKVLLSELMSEVEANYEPAEVFHWHGSDIEVKKFLSPEEAKAFVEKVVDSCFDEDGSYDPGFYNFILRICTLAIYTNIELDADLTAQYALVYETDIFDYVTRTAVDWQYLVEDCERKIKYRAHSNVEVVENELKTLESIFKQAGDVLSGISQEDIKAIISSVADGKVNEEKMVKAYIGLREEPQDVD